MRKYDSYKDSGVEWIGEIPSGWMVSKFKYDTYNPVQYGINISGDKYVEEGIRFIRITDINESGELNPNDGKFLISEDVPTEFLLRKYDVLFCRSGHTVGKTYLHTSNGPFTSGGYLVRFNFRNYTESRFIFYISKTEFYWDWIKLNTVVSTIENVNGDKYQNFSYPKPPLSEQHQIVSYLDRKTAQIDSLIAKTQRKIELLKENRTSLINEAVTKGLNRHVEMKDSGVEWIGEIPDAWILKPLKHIIKNLNSGTSVNSEDTPVNSIDELGVLKTSCVFGDTFRPEENKKVVMEEYDRVKCPVLKDSIIFSRMNTPDLVGSNGYVDKDFGNLFLPDRLWITEFFENIELSVKWLSFVTISRKFRSELSSRSTGTSPSMKNITKDDLLTIKIPYPSISEQHQIVSYLDEHTQLIDKTVAVEERRIELLKAYRQSLISEVVTGKRKVITDE